MALNFVEALLTDNLAAIKAIPKTDLHCHAFFGTRVENVERWLGHPLAKPPPKMNGLEGMLAYAGEFLTPHLRCRSGFEFVATSALHDAIRDGVVIFEMSFDIRTAEFYPDGLTGLCLFIENLVDCHRMQINLRPELGFPRTSADNREHVALAHRAIELGTFHSLDLYDDEAACSPEAVKPLYAKARAAGMKLKAHVGEFGGAEEIRRTVERLQLDEVQHGISAAASKEVMHWLAENDIQLNVCPTSNVMLDAVSELAVHPVRVLHDNGVRVSVNTDDLVIFGQSVSDEYRNLYRAGVFSAQALDAIRRASLNVSTCYSSEQ